MAWLSRAESVRTAHPDLAAERARRLVLISNGPPLAKDVVHRRLVPVRVVVLDALFEREAGAAYIIHGHGTGALKREVRDWLGGCRYVLDWRRGDRHEGGDGVTAVLLR